MSGIFKAYDIRGIYPAELNADVAEAIGRAYIEFTGAKKVVVGRDMRPHSEPLFEGLSRGMLAQGADVIDELLRQRHSEGGRQRDDYR